MCGVWMQQFITIGRCWVIEEKKGWGLGTDSMRGREGEKSGETLRL